MTRHRARKIEWGTILLFAGGLVLGKATFDSDLAQSVGDWVATTTGANDVWIITAITTAMAIVLPPGVMLRAGLIYDVVGFVVTTTSLRLILPPMGLA